jgi:argininosuccinate lyase
LADYLAHKEVPFRQSHHLVGQAVRRAEELGVPLKQLALTEYQAIDSRFTEDLFEIFDFKRSVDARSGEGGTASAAVRAQIERAKARARRAADPSGHASTSGGFRQGTGEARMGVN